MPDREKYEVSIVEIFDIHFSVLSTFSTRVKCGTIMGIAITPILKLVQLAIHTHDFHTCLQSRQTYYIHFCQMLAAHWTIGLHALSSEPIIGLRTLSSEPIITLLSCLNCELISVSLIADQGTIMLQQFSAPSDKIPHLAWNIASPDACAIAATARKK